MSNLTLTLSTPINNGFPTSKKTLILGSMASPSPHGITQTSPQNTPDSLSETRIDIDATTPSCSCNETGQPLNSTDISPPEPSPISIARPSRPPSMSLARAGAIGLGTWIWSIYDRVLCCGRAKRWVGAETDLDYDYSGYAIGNSRTNADKLNSGNTVAAAAARAANGWPSEYVHASRECVCGGMGECDACMRAYSVTNGQGRGLGAVYQPSVAEFPIAVGKNKGSRSGLRRSGVEMGAWFKSGDNDGGGAAAHAYPYQLWPPLPQYGNSSVEINPISRGCEVNLQSRKEARMHARGDSTAKTTDLHPAGRQIEPSSAISSKCSEDQLEKGNTETQNYSGNGGNTATEPQRNRVHSRVSVPVKPALALIPVLRNPRSLEMQLKESGGLRSVGDEEVNCPPQLLNSPSYVHTLRSQPVLSAHYFQSQAAHSSTVPGSAHAPSLPQGQDGSLRGPSLLSGLPLTRLPAYPLCPSVEIAGRQNAPTSPTRRGLGISTSQRLAAADSAPPAPGLTAPALRSASGTGDVDAIPSVDGETDDLELGQCLPTMNATLAEKNVNMHAADECSDAVVDTEMPGTPSSVVFRGIGPQMHLNCLGNAENATAVVKDTVQGEVDAKLDAHPTKCPSQACTDAELEEKDSGPPLHVPEPVLERPSAANGRKGSELKQKSGRKTSKKSEKQNRKAKR